MKNAKIKLAIIDPQNDFIDDGGTLYVNGAEKSVMNIVNLVNTIGHKLDDIDETLDSHHQMHIANPLFWMNSKGEHPSPFTLIHIEDVENGKWYPTIPSLRDWGLHYVKTLKSNGRYELCIWFPHCLIGSWGACVYPPLYDALVEWERKFKAVVNKTAKGSNIKTEHYSALKADVTDPEDSGTMLNTGLIEKLEDSTMLLISGYASSHCVKFTVEDIADNFGVDSIKNMYLLTDCMNPVKGFEKESEEFLENIKNKGANLITSTELLKGGI